MLWYVSNWFTLILSPKSSWLYHQYFNKYSYTTYSFTTHGSSKSLLSFISEEHDVVPKNWALTEDERAFLATMQITEENSCFKTRNCKTVTGGALERTVKRIE